MELDKKEIALLIENLCKKGNEEALETLYSIYYPKLLRYISLLVKNRDSAEELVSDVFLAVWDNREKIRYPAAFNTYIYKIAKYKAINYLKTKKGETVSLDNASYRLFEELNSYNPELILISRQNVDHINRMIEKLPNKCKMAFKLVREDKLSYKEVAEIMEISVNTVDAHIYRAIKTIKQELENQLP